MGTRPHRPCSICGREVPPHDDDPPNRAFPFCSPACKLVDLGRWLDGDYRLPGSSIESTTDAEGLPFAGEHDA